MSILSILHAPSLSPVQYRRSQEKGNALVSTALLSPPQCSFRTRHVGRTSILAATQSFMLVVVIITLGQSPNESYSDNTNDT